MKKILCVAIVMIAILLTPFATPVASAAPAPPPTVSEVLVMDNGNCAGQGYLVNNGPYIAEILSINDARWHQDVAPWSTAVYHVDYNQPVMFTLYRAGFLEKYLASTKVAAGCEFAGDQMVMITDNHLENITYPSGFSPYFPPYNAGW